MSFHVCHICDLFVYYELYTMWPGVGQTRANVALTKVLRNHVKVNYLHTKRMQTYAQKGYQWKTFTIFWLFSAIFGSLKSFYLATMILDHLKIANQPISTKKWSKNMA